MNFSMNEGVCLHEIIYDESGNASDYRILDINPAYEELTGLTREKTIGKKASELYGTGKPPYFDIYERVAASGQSESFETYFPPMSKHFSISAFSPQKGQFGTVFTDVTERKQMEQSLLKSGTNWNSAFSSGHRNWLKVKKNTARYLIQSTKVFALSK